MSVPLATGGRLEGAHTVLPGLLMAAALLAGCATGRFADWTYRDGQTAYRVGPLPDTWHRLELSGANVAFSHQGGGSVLANSQCGGVKDVPLDVLTNQALFGVEGKQEHAREPLTLDGRSALRTQVTGTLDGVPVSLALVVLKKDGCVYDFQLVAGQESFAALTADFDLFVAGFGQLPVSSR